MTTAKADLRRQAGPHVFVDDLDEPVLDESDRHHLERSLRLRAEDPLTISDGAGRWRTALFGSDIEPTGPVYDVDPPAYEIGLGIALTKAAKPEYAVQKATEIGIDHIIVFQATHSVARWDETKRRKNESRLAKVAREASMQSRRISIPTLQVVSGLDEVIAQRGSSGLARADFGGMPVNSSHRFVLVGPEGGWSESERAAVPDTIDLGQTVLRAETAAIVASSTVAAIRPVPR